MERIFAILTVILCSLFLLDCSSTKLPSVEAEVKEPVNKTCIDQKQNVNFQNVGFSYDLCAFGNVKSEEIPEYRMPEPVWKPDFVAPKHVEFTFDLEHEGWGATIGIYPIKDFPKMYAVAPELVRATKKEILDLEKVLLDKNFRSNGEIPYIPFIDASQEFQTNVKLSPFNNGRGIFFVTYLSTEFALISNDHLRYIFEGLTNDGKYYVLAEIPLSVKFLPDVSQEEFEGYERKFLLEDY